MNWGFGRWAVLALAAPLLCEPAAASSIYTYRPSDGVRTFSDAKPQHGPYAVSKYGRPTATVSCAGLTPRSMEARASSYRALIEKHAAAENVPASLVSAVMRVESCYDRRAVSRAGARGLMQLMPHTATELGVLDSFDPEQNIKGGVRYLAKMLKRFNHNTTMALAAYNAGPDAVDKYEGLPPYPETTSYVRRVLKFYRVGQQPTHQARQTRS